MAEQVVVVEQLCVLPCRLDCDRGLSAKAAGTGVEGSEYLFVAEGVPLDLPRSAAAARAVSLSVVTSRNALARVRVVGGT